MSEFHSTKAVKARKAHRCHECAGQIQPGETYQRGAGRYEGDFYSYALCAPCDQAWSWTHREFNPDPEWCHIGDLPTLIQECAERFEQLRVAAYIRRQWINRATGERYAFPFPRLVVGVDPGAPEAVIVFDRETGRIVA